MSYRHRHPPDLGNSSVATATPRARVKRRWEVRIVRASHRVRGVAAGVIGLIAAVTVDILDTSVVDVPTAVLAVAAFAALNRWHGKLTVVAIVLGCGAAGALLQATSVV